MGCCGQNRRYWQQAARRLNMDDKPPPPELDDPARVSYQGETMIVVAGPATGNTYLFPAHSGALEVDGRDVEGILALGDFTRA